MNTHASAISEPQRELPTIGSTDDATAKPPQAATGHVRQALPELMGAELKGQDETRPASRDRCSPDPCRHTDRYRLVTPFSLRL